MPHKLLVIDDSMTVRKMVELSVRDTGWTVEFAATGGEGMSRALAGAPDVVLLDFVLPDMKAIEVCERLSAHPRGADLAIILMSAKMEKVRDLFAPYSMVVDFVGKPFSTDDIRERIARARALRTPPVSAAAPVTPVPAAPPGAEARPVPPPTFSHRQREVAANTIYQRLRRELAAIPSWMKDLGDSPPAMYFARKILSPGLIEDLLESLSPLYRDVLAPPAARGDEDARGAAGADACLAGRAEKAALFELLRLLALGSRTGELRLAHGAQTVVSYWQSGEVLLVTSLDPTDYVRGGPSLDEVAADERERAERAQRTTGVPVYVTLHERGADGLDLPALLEQQGARLLAQAREAQAARFVWRELESLPAYVEAYGSHIPLGLETGHKETLAQLTLERLRRPSSWREIQLHLPGPDAVYARATGFSTRLSQLSISASEQRVLTLVDGRNSVTAIAERSGIVPVEVARILYRLASIDLVSALARSSSRQNGASARPVMILEPDRAGFHAPLRAMLACRTQPLDLIDLAGEADLLGAIERECPALVILNGSESEIGDVARAIRATPHLANVSLAAVLESQVKVKMDDLAAAGFDAVLVKPVLYSDLSKLIASSFLASNSVSRGPAMENHGEDSRR